jgi:tetrahydromethanopterin S-methyltransferase subunit D
MSKRKTIGPVYASYPARDIGLWFGDRAFKIIASIACTIIWCGVYYILLVVINFNKNTFLKGSKDTTVNELFRSDISMMVLGVTSIIISIFVFRTRIGNRQTVKKSKR